MAAQTERMQELVWQFTGHTGEVVAPVLIETKADPGVRIHQSSIARSDPKCVRAGFIEDSDRTERFVRWLNITSKNPASSIDSLRFNRTIASLDTAQSDESIPFSQRGFPGLSWFAKQVGVLPHEGCTCWQVLFEEGWHTRSKLFSSKGIEF